VKNFSIVTNGFEDERKSISGKVSKIEQKIAKARDLYLEDKLDEDDFREVKSKNKVELDELIFKLNALKETKKDNNVEHKLEEALRAVTNISERYKNADSLDREL